MEYKHIQKARLDLNGKRFFSGKSNTATDDSETQDGEGKVKNKLMSMWNNMKYGWSVKMKTNFSKDSPVCLLGQLYHRRSNVSFDSGVPEALPLDSGVREALPEDNVGFEDFKLDFYSRLWLTYRREFPILNGSNFTTDCGWGCMLRSGQMLLAQALVCHFLGRDWRWCPDQLAASKKLQEEDRRHRNIIKWFGDKPSQISPLSIHTLVTLGEKCGKKPGDWYGPASVAHLLRQAVEQAAVVNEEFRDLTVYVSQDCAVYLQDIRDQCSADQSSIMYSTSDRNLHGNGFQNVTRNTFGVSTSRSENVQCFSSEENMGKSVKRIWKSVIVLIPVRLGVEKFNSIYGQCLQAMLSLDSCIGIIGGRPKHSLYFVGFQEDKLIHLDPHYCQEMVDVWQPNFSLSSFHCRSPRKMNIQKIDPSCCIGFYCKTREDFDHFVKSVKKLLCPQMQKAEYPMFVFVEGRSSDAVTVQKYIIPDEPCRGGRNTREENSDDDLESEEFEVLGVYE